MKRGLLALAVTLTVANLVVVVVRAQKNTLRPAQNPLAAFDAATKRHDYKAAYALTDLGDIQVVGGSSAITLAYFTAFQRAHPLRDLTVQQGIVHVPTTDLMLTAPTGPLPSLAVDGVPVPLREQRLKTGRTTAAAWIYHYALVVISGPHTLAVGKGPVTAPRSLTGMVRGTTASIVVSLAASSSGDRRSTAALDAITGTCPDDSCLVAPCSGRGGEYVLDAWGIGTPPIVARALVGDQVIAPMPPDGWSIAVTFMDQGQPPGLSGHEKTAQ
ncbi:MAG TPA: hypothetical protein VGW79_01990, partial [Actinomycetota bacterium]|nr:hypothetical protein [Actinomycetota bacterium]